MRRDAGQTSWGSASSFSALIGVLAIIGVPAAIVACVVTFVLPCGTSCASVTSPSESSVHAVNLTQNRDQRSSSPGPDLLQDAILFTVNQSRAERKCPQLQNDTTLEQLAQRRAAQEAGTAGSRTSNGSGSSLIRLARSAGVTGPLIQLVAHGAVSVDQLSRAITLAGSSAPVMDCELASSGIGVAPGAVVILARPAQARPLVPRRAPAPARVN